MRIEILTTFENARDYIVQVEQDNPNISIA